MAARRRRMAMSAAELGCVIVPVLAIGLLGYVIAGVIGKVFAEVIIDVLWPASGFVCATALPLTFGLRQVEWLVECVCGRTEVPHSAGPPAVRDPGEEDDAPDEDAEPELPESARVLLQHAVVLTRTMSAS